MLSRLIQIILIFVLAALQVSWSLWLGGATPGLVLAGLLAFSLAGDLLDTLWWIVVGGLLLDLMAGPLVGYTLGIFTITGGLMLYLQRQFFHRSSGLLAFGLFLLTAFLNQLLNGLIFNQLNWPMIIASFLTAQLASLAYHVIVMSSRRREVISLA